MFSTLVGCCQGTDRTYTTSNKVAAGIDFAGFLTMLVLGILTVTGTAPVAGSIGGKLLLIGGGLGLTILALKYIRPPHTQLRVSDGNRLIQSQYVVPPQTFSQ